MTSETDPEASAVRPDAPAPPDSRASRSRRRRWPLAIAVVLAAAAAGGWYLSRNEGDDGATRSSGLPPATATVTRQNLQDIQQEDGTLGYGDTYQLTSARQGVLTWLPAEGSTITRGKPLYKVSNEPVPLLYGGLPLYRTLRDGVDDGPDVLELERNLAALGYSGFAVDEQFTDATADAVAQWQSDNGLPDTAVVNIADVVVLPGAVRVSDQKAQVGDTVVPSRSLLAYTGTTRTVSVAVDVADQQLAKVGGKVTVELPDGKTTTGTVSSIGTVAQAAASSSSGGSGSASGSSSSSDDATITVTVTLDRPRSAGTLDEAPVTVDFVSAQRTNVLSVPVAALLALSGGGYGVQVVDGDTTRIVAVTTGLFADTRVEVSGDGVTAGMKVGVPTS